jgi:hypothetical protein
MPLILNCMDGTFTESIRDGDALTIIICDWGAWLSATTVAAVGAVLCV